VIEVPEFCFNSNFYYIRQSHGYINILHIYIYIYIYISLLLDKDVTRGTSGSGSRCFCHV